MLRYNDRAIDTVPIERRAPVTLPVPARRFALCLGAAPFTRNVATMPPA